MDFRRISLDQREEWDVVVESFEHCASHRWHFNHAQMDSTIELVVGESADLRCALPISSRQEPWGIELVSPLGFAGPLIEGNVRSIESEWTTYWKSQGAVTAYIQLHPLLQEEQKQLFGAHNGYVMNHSLVVDLRQTEAEFKSGLSRDHRARLNKWFRSSNRVSSQSRAAKQEAFVRLYTDFAARRNLSSLYTFTEEQLWAMSSNPQMEIIAIENDSEVIEAVALFPYGTTIGYYYLNGSSVEGQQHARALIWTAMLRLKELGLTHLNLAGGNSPYDALHAFKSRFGATDHPTNAIKQIIDEEKYRALCQQHKVSLDKDGYFPPWKSRISS